MKTLLIALLGFLMVGCATAPDVKTQYVYVPTHTPITQELLQPCVMKSVVPDKQTYLASTTVEKEASLAKYSMSVIADWQVCANQVRAIAAEDAARTANSKKVVP
jgi:hypothetical protein